MILGFDNTCTKTPIDPSSHLFWDVTYKRSSELVFEIGFSSSDPIIFVPPMTAFNLSEFITVQFENFESGKDYDVKFAYDKSRITFE
jgi:hypothetical protein